MSEISVFDDTIFELLEELYRLNSRSWKRRILLVLVQHKQATYKGIKEELLEVPDILVYRCIQELVKGEIVRRTEENRHVVYSLIDASGYVKEILDDLKMT